MDSILTSLSSFTSCYYYVVAIVVSIIFYEQISYSIKKGPIPGPTLVAPFIGNAISLVWNPACFWEIQADLAKTSQDGISANYVLGKFIVFIRSTDLSHKVFANVRPNAFQFLGHPFGKILFGEDNMIYKFGQEHKEIRHRIVPNFTRKALSTYLSCQQKVILKHLRQWAALSEKHPKEPTSLRSLCWDMNLETSQAVFVGTYLNPDSKERFRNDYNLFNVGMLSLPINVPGFGFHKAKLATNRIIKTLVYCAKESEKNIKTGIEPTCLVDFYVQGVLGEHVPDDKSISAIGGHLYDFLFAAQDASTSSLLWAVTLLDSHPEVLKKIRNEVAGIWSPESNAPITAEQLREMKYTEAVAMEVVRIKAPATVIPHIATESFPLTDTYTITKGTMVFPSVYESSFQGFTEPYKFDPERFLEERREGRRYKNNFLVFGAGAHQCVGQRYAINHLILFIAMFTSLLDFKRHQTEDCDEVIYVPTICPKDGCKVFLSHRSTRFLTFLD